MDPRELIRLAQADELAGDHAGAAEKLRRAARSCRESGRDARAEQLERHAARLMGAEESPAAPTAQPERSAAESKAQNSPEVLIEPERPSGPLYPHPDPLPGGEASWDPYSQRAPSRADPSLRAWCSFCCRPDGEVGALISSPTGSFICRGCAEEGLALLGAPASLPAAPEVTSPRPAALLEGQQQVFEQLVLAVRAGRRRILLVGPEGSGKTELLAALEAFGLGERISGAALLDPPESALLLIDGLRNLGAAGREQAAEALAERPFVLCVRGELPTGGLRVRTGERARPLYTTAELRLATGAPVPLPLLERVELALSLPPLDRSGLRDLAGRVLAAGSRRADDALVDRLIEEAVRSGRGAHELVALIRRLPSGASQLAPEED